MTLHPVPATLAGLARMVTAQAAWVVNIKPKTVLFHVLRVQAENIRMLSMRLHALIVLPARTPQELEQSVCYV